MNYRQEPVGVCMLSEMAFGNNGIRGYCIISKGGRGRRDRRRPAKELQ